jgi:hypothetical protein
MRMIRWMYGISLRDRVPSEELRVWVGVEAISDVCMRNRLRWFGHVERKEDDDWVKRCARLVDLLIERVLRHTILHNFG